MPGTHWHWCSTNTPLTSKCLPLLQVGKWGSRGENQPASQQVTWGWGRRPASVTVPPVQRGGPGKAVPHWAGCPITLPLPGYGS